MAIIEINAYVWGARNTWAGQAFVSPEGVACPIKIQAKGQGKYSSGSGLATSEEYPNGIYEIKVETGDIEILHYPADGGIRELPDYRLAPATVVRFAEKFAEASNCYHCKCLERHLQECSQ